MMGFALPLLIVGAIAGTQPSFAASPVIGHVYVDNNTTVNMVSAYDQHADGSLTAVNGSPFATGGSGTGAIIGSQGAIQVDGHFLLAVNAGSNDVSVLRIKAGGRLAPVNGSPFASGGDSPVSIAAVGRLVYIGNSGGSTANYAGFRLTSTGRLEALSNATFSLPMGTVIGDVLLSANGAHLLGTRVDTATLPSLVDSFSVRANGKLIPAPGSPYAAQSTGPFGSEFRPTNPNQVFVSNAHAGAGNGTVSAYHVNANGGLKSIGPSPYPDFQTAPCWVTISRNGEYLYAVNTAVPSISRFYVSREGTLSLLGSTPFNSPTGLRPFDARLSQNGKYLDVIDAGIGAISVFTVQNGALTEITGSPIMLPAGVTPFGLATD